MISLQATYRDDLRQMGRRTLSNRTGAVGGQYSFTSQYILLNLPDQIIARFDQGVDYDDLEDTKLYTSYRHELAHFVQNAFTTYGLWKTLALRSAGAMFHQATSFGQEAGRDLPVPAYHLFKFPMPDDVEKTQIDEAIGIGRGITASIHFMESGHRVPTGWQFEHLNAPLESTNPRVATPNDQKIVFTAGTLLEYQAYAQQLFGLWNTRGIPEEHAKEIGSNINEYLTVRHPQNLVAWAFHGKFPDAIQCRFLTYELATLALCPEWPTTTMLSFAIVGGRSLKQQAEKRIPWEHFHPGWRFLTHGTRSNSGL
jgi:hypothetical protein